MYFYYTSNKIKFGVEIKWVVYYHMTITWLCVCARSAFSSECESSCCSSLWNPWDPCRLWSNLQDMKNSADSITVTHSSALHVGMAREKNGGSNQWISSYTLITCLIRSSDQRLWEPTVAFWAVPWPIRRLTWPETIANVVNRQLGKSQFCSSVFLFFPG